jgi:hypothetical protein
MPRNRTRTLRPWTPSDLKTLRSLAGRAPTATIARKLGRTPIAVTVKASTLQISLAQRAQARTRPPTRRR